MPVFSKSKLTISVAEPGTPFYIVTLQKISLNSKAKLFISYFFFSFFFFLVKAPHMKPIRRCWNVLHGSGVDLWRRMALFRKRELVWVGVRERAGGGSVFHPSWWRCLEAFITLADELVPQHHLLTTASYFIPETSSQCLRLGFLDYIKTERHLNCLVWRNRWPWEYFISLLGQTIL